MRDGPNITTVAALIGDQARAQVLTVLLAGQALTATELADAAGVTRQTISSHLARLVDAGLLAVRRRGATVISGSPTPMWRACWSR